MKIRTCAGNNSGYLETFLSLHNNLGEFTSQKLSSKYMEFSQE